jgi:hypothetical protein
MPRMSPYRHPVARLAQFVAVLVVSLALASCGNSKTDLKLLDETLKAYQSTVRWADVADTMQYVDPAKAEEVAPTSFELERWKQVRVGGLRAHPPTPMGDYEMQQVIQIELINVNTQAVRSVSTINTWRYDETAEKWWLMNGLPKIGGK